MIDFCDRGKKRLEVRGAMVFPRTTSRSARRNGLPANNVWLTAYSTIPAPIATNASAKRTSRIPLPPSGSARKNNSIQFLGRVPNKTPVAIVISPNPVEKPLTLLMGPSNRRRQPAIVSRSSLLRHGFQLAFQTLNILHPIHLPFAPFFLGSCPKSVIGVEGLSIQGVPVRGVLRSTLMRHPSGAWLGGWRRCQT